VCVSLIPVSHAHVSRTSPHVCHSLLTLFSVCHAHLSRTRPCVPVYLSPLSRTPPTHSSVSISHDVSLNHLSLTQLLSHTCPYVYDGNFARALTRKRVACHATRFFRKHVASLSERVSLRSELERFGLRVRKVRSLSQLCLSKKTSLSSPLSLTTSLAHVCLSHVSLALTMSFSSLSFTHHVSFTCLPLSLSPCVCVSLCVCRLFRARSHSFKCVSMRSEFERSCLRVSQVTSEGLRGHVSLTRRLFYTPPCVSLVFLPPLETLPNVTATKSVAVCCSVLQCVAVCCRRSCSHSPECVSLRLEFER